MERERERERERELELELENFILQLPQVLNESLAQNLSNN